MERGFFIARFFNHSFIKIIEPISRHTERCL
jgi:hypothetical protein